VTQEQEPQQELQQEQQQPDIDYDSLLKERLGLGLDEAKAIKDKYERLKVVEEDEWLNTFVSAYSSTKDATKVLEVMTTDFSKMPPDELVKYELKQRYPDVSKKVFDKLLEEELVKYGITDDMYDDEEERNELMDVRTRDIRAKLMAEREKFLKSSPAATNDAEYQKFVDYVNNHPSTKLIQQDGGDTGKVAFGDFNYAVDKSLLVDSAIDGNKFFTLFNKEGEVDLERFYKTVAFASDPDGFLKAQNAHAVAKAKIEWLKELKNPSGQPSSKPPSGQISVRLVQ
jgi:hypothetical protein